MSNDLPIVYVINSKKTTVPPKLSSCRIWIYYFRGSYLNQISATDPLMICYTGTFKKLYSQHLPVYFQRAQLSGTTLALVTLSSIFCHICDKLFHQVKNLKQIAKKKVWKGEKSGEQKDVQKYT